MGFKNYCVDKKQQEEWDGAFGKSLRPHTAITAFIDFLDNSQELRLELIPLILDELQKIKTFFDANRKWEFIGSSLLITFEADPEKEPKVVIKMIDFAHVQIKEGQKDEGYLKGLNNIIEILQTLRGLMRWDRFHTDTYCCAKQCKRDPLRRKSSQSKEGSFYTSTVGRASSV